MGFSGGRVCGRVTSLTPLIPHTVTLMHRPLCRYAVPYGIVSWMVRGGEYEVLIEMTSDELMKTGEGAFALRYEITRWYIILYSSAVSFYCLILHIISWGTMALVFSGPIGWFLFTFVAVI